MCVFEVMKVERKPRKREAGRERKTNGIQMMRVGVFGGMRGPEIDGSGGWGKAERRAWRRGKHRDKQA